MAPTQIGPDEIEFGHNRIPTAADQIDAGEEQFGSGDTCLRARDVHRGIAQIPEFKIFFGAAQHPCCGRVESVGLLAAEEDQRGPRRLRPVLGNSPGAGRRYRYSRRGQVPPVARGAVPRDRGRRIEQVGHPGGPGPKLLAPVSHVIPDRTKDHQVGLLGLGVVPCQPSAVQSAPA